MQMDLPTGRWHGTGVVEGRRTVSKLATYFAETAPDDERLVYETFGLPEPTEPDALVATTVLQPGDVHGEFFMTRGHFHVNPLRGETCLTLSGEGLLVLTDRDGAWMTLPMTVGSIQHIDAKWAHRVVNIGTEPLVFLVTWMSDCGHDYESIENQGFPVRIMRSEDGGFWCRERDSNPHGD